MKTLNDTKMPGFAPNDVKPGIFFSSEDSQYLV